MPGNSRKTRFEDSSTDKLTDAERAYYREMWGFDPGTDWQTSPPLPDVRYLYESEVEGISEIRLAQIVYYYETSIPLENDPELQAARVTLHVRVGVDDQGASHNRMVLQRGKKSAEIECVHTVIFNGPAQKALALSEEELDDLIESDEVKPAILPPWEHFAALKSFAAGLAALGVLEGVPTALPQFEMPFIEALNTVAGDLVLPLGDEYFARLLERAPEKWILDHLERDEEGFDWYQEHHYNLDRIFNNRPLLESLDAAAQVKLFHSFLKIYDNEMERYKRKIREDDGPGNDVIAFYSPRILSLALTENFIATLDPATIKTISEMIKWYLEWYQEGVGDQVAGRLNELDPVRQELGRLKVKLEAVANLLQIHKDRSPH